MVDEPRLSELAADALGGRRTLVGRVVRAFLALFEDSPSWLVITTAAGMLAVLAVVDYATATELRMVVFYWAPIAMVSWYLGRGWGIVTVAASSILWTCANWQEFAATGAWDYLAWNLAVNTFAFAALGHLVTTTRQLIDRQRQLALTDEMTGVPNARAFSTILQAEVSRGARAVAPLSLAYIDVDNFKDVNDSFGHDAGNDLLQRVAHTIRGSIRGEDVVARLGGDEFAVLLPATSSAEALVVVERVRTVLAELVATEPVQISVSIGLVTCTSCTATHEQLLKAADSLMYEAKAAGRNRVRHDTIDAATLQVQRQ